MNCIKSTIIRTSLVYGSSHEHNNFLTWVKSTIANNKKIDIVCDQYRTPTYVFDLALIISKIINMRKYGVFHISSGEKLSIFDIVCNIASCYGLNSGIINKIDSKSLSQFAKRPMDTSLQIDKAIKYLKFKPTKLKNALTDIS